MYKKETQYFRFSLYGFLKNLKFYEPFFLLFLLSKDISFFEAGILYSIREIAINILEIPAGVISDTVGRRRTMLISFIFYIASFLLFYFSQSYSVLVLAMLVFAFGDVFRTGTHKAMIYDYLDSKGWSSKRVEYYGNTRAWSQRGSALSSLISALIVITTKRYDIVFLFAIIPYLMNLFNLGSYPSWLDGKQEKFHLAAFKSGFIDVIKSLRKTLSKATILKVYTNSTLTSGFFNSVKDYLQPMIVAFAVSLPVLTQFSENDRSSALMGVTYFFIFLMTSRASTLSGKFASISGSESRSMNISYLGFIFAALLSGIFFYLEMDFLAITMLIAIFIIENLRRPVCVSKIASVTDSSALSTYLSVDSQLKSLLTMIISPLLGLLADKLGPGVGIAIIAVALFFVFPLVRLKTKD